MKAFDAANEQCIYKDEQLNKSSEVRSQRPMAEPC